MSDGWAPSSSTAESHTMGWRRGDCCCSSISGMLLLLPAWRPSITWIGCSAGCSSPPVGISLLCGVRRKGGCVEAVCSESELLTGAAPSKQTISTHLAHLAHLEQALELGGERAAHGGKARG